jgi:demethylmenaquinone methyltransferase/2-methoxy-6-polyprenyl-1,4-benzoquinol methylase
VDEKGLIEEQIEYYRRRAPEYDETSRPEGDPLLAQSRELEKALDAFRPQGDILELACGTGSWTRRLLAYASSITALDASPEMVELNRQKLDDPRVTYLVSDLFKWEPDRRYDTVFFGNWLSHVPNSRFEDFWRLVARSLVPRGRVFFVDEAADAWRKEEWLTDHSPDDSTTPLVRRPLRDGSIHRAVKVYWDAAALEERLDALGWGISVHNTGVFYWGEGAPRI